MNYRNYVMFSIICLFVFIGIVIYIYADRKIKDVQSDISIIKRKDINERVERDEK